MWAGASGLRRFCAELIGRWCAENLRVLSGTRRHKVGGDMSEVVAVCPVGSLGRHGPNYGHPATKAFWKQRKSKMSQAGSGSQSQA